MTGKRRSPKTHTLGNEAARELARTAGGTFVTTISEDDLDNALDRLSSGDTMLNVTTDLEVSRSALYLRARRDPDFHAALMAALEMGQHARLENADLGLHGVEGYTTGSVERDKAIADFAKWTATRLNRKTYGDKVEIDQRTLVINVDPHTTGLI